MSAYLGSSIWLMADAHRWVFGCLHIDPVQGIMGIPATINPNFYSFFIGKSHAMKQVH